MYHEYQGVIVLNLLHGRLCSKGVSYDGIVVHLVTTWSRSARIFWLPSFLQSFWTIENHFRAYFLLNGCVSSLQDGLLGLQGLSLCLRGSCRCVEKLVLPSTLFHHSYCLLQQLPTLATICHFLFLPVTLVVFFSFGGAIFPLHTTRARKKGQGSRVRVKIMGGV